MNKGTIMPKFPVFSNNLKELRKTRKWTQEQAAIAIHCSLKAYQQWERGETVPYIDSLPEIAAAFGVSCDYLLGLIVEKDHDLHFIHEITGLSEKAIEVLKSLKVGIVTEPYTEGFFIDIINHIIEHDKFRTFIYRLFQSAEATFYKPIVYKGVKEYHKDRKKDIKNAHRILTSYGYTVHSPGENNMIHIYDAKQVIAGIIDDIFRIEQTENIELRN